MKTIKIPLARDLFSSYEDEDLSEWELQRVEEAGADLVVYMYGVGCYCGTGNMLARDGKGRWVLEGLGHCSCDGPVGSFYSRDFDRGGTLASIKERLTEDYRKEVAALFDAAEAASG